MNQKIAYHLTEALRLSQLELPDDVLKERMKALMPFVIKDYLQSIKEPQHINSKNPERDNVLWMSQPDSIKIFHDWLTEKSIKWDIVMLKRIFLDAEYCAFTLQWPLSDYRFAYLFGNFVGKNILNIPKNRKWKELNRIFRNAKNEKFDEGSMATAYSQQKADKKFRNSVDGLIIKIKKEEKIYPKY